MIKVSARASPSLVEMGMDMGEIMREAASKFAGRGGRSQDRGGCRDPCG
jgi:RecJ-like exonuclease